MTKLKSSYLPYVSSFSFDCDPIESYLSEEKILLFEMAFKFDIYQAKKIIDKEKNPQKSADKFYNFCKEIIVLQDLIESGKDPNEIIIYDHHRVIYNSLLACEYSQTKSSQYKDFFSFFCGYFASKIDKDCFIKKFLDEDFLRKADLIINKKMIIGAIHFFDHSKEYFSKDDVENFISKYQKIKKFIKFIDKDKTTKSPANNGLEVTIISKSEDLKDIKKSDDFSSILEKNQLLIPFEKAIYFTLYQNNFLGYIENLEQRFQSNLQDSEIFLLEDETYSQFNSNLKNLMNFMNDVIVKEEKIKLLSLVKIKKECSKELEPKDFTRLSSRSFDLRNKA
jgi:hypothetical protein